MMTNPSNNSVLGQNGWALLFVALILSVALQASARQGTPPRSFQQQVQPLGTVQKLVLPPTDVQAELAKDAGKGMPTPLQFAVPHTVEVTPVTHGTWELLPDGRLWRLRISSAGATDVNLGFTTFWLPEGATLHISSETENYHQGPYTARDNKPHGQLWTPLVPGEAAVVELFVPAQAAQEPQLVLSQVSTGYRDLFYKKQDLGGPKIGSCNVDVICPQGDPWRNEIRSVGAYTVNGAWTCTGTLVGNTANDFRNFFLTANHCGLNSGNAPTVVVYWNFQSPACGMLSGGSLAQNQSGAIFRASRADVDFALIELDDVPSPSFNVHYAGWDRSGTAPTGCVGIHQPGCDEKCISFCTTPLTTINSCIGSGGGNTHWNVHWSLGVTEPGSSGSGIWDSATHRYVGFLSGGASECGGANLTDCYGKVSVAWSGASSSSRLSDWLDAGNVGATSIPGVDPFPHPVITTAGSSLISEGCTPANGVPDPGETVTVNLSLRNVGTVATANLVGTLQAGGGITSPSAPQDYGVLAAGGASVSRAFTFTASGACGGTVIATLQLQDGTNQYDTVTFNFTLGSLTLTTLQSQNFDGVTAPALPAGWVSSPASIWTTSTGQRDTLPNSAFTSDPTTTSDKQLVSPSITINSATAQLTFRHWYSTESGYDGGVVEISTSGGAWTDIVTAGGSFVAGGYTGTLLTGNPMAGRSAWTASSGGFITTTVNLPSGTPGRNIQLRWRFGSDSSVGGIGWYVDTISINLVSYDCCVALVSPAITAGPDSLTRNAGTTATFTIAAIGQDPLRYQWIRNGTNYLSDGGNVSGATNATLTLSPVFKADEGSYSMVVTNAAGSASSSNAVLTVIDPVVNAQPQSQTMLVGADVTFSVGATGTEPLGYYWRRNGTPIAGASDSIYTLHNAQVSDSGSQFSCLVSNGAGMATSQPATLTVTPPVAGFVTRHLPAGYMGGVSLTVSLVCAPPAGASVYAVEDRPPAGWIPGLISDGGVFDVVSGKVKYGPFFDNTARTLTCQITPPVGTTNRVCLVGAGSVDGVDSVIGGDSCLDMALTHPADSNADGQLVVNEVTAYGSAWKNGKDWPWPPNPIPIGYVTRAGALWRWGECYRYDGSQLPPLCWVNCTKDAAAEGAKGVSIARRVISGNTVFLTVVPAASVSVYAVEEGVPPGFVVSRITPAGGVFDVGGRKVKWGPWFDNTQRTLTYTLTASVGISGNVPLVGTGSFDGVDIAVTGDRQMVASDGEPPQLVVNLYAGMALSGVIGRTYRVEWSSAMSGGTWTSAATLILTNTTQLWVDTSAPVRSNSQRFYRAVLLP
jgi:hypothetical protein